MIHSLGLTVTAPSVNVTNRTYWAPGPPVPGPFLIRLSEEADRAWVDVKPISETYGLGRPP